VAALIAYLDTHVVVMLTQPARHLPRKAIATLRQARLLKISPATVLELQFLREIGRLNSSPDNFLEAAREAFTLEVCDQPFDDVVSAALALSWTRDPFDRIIVAQADVGQGVLLTKDRQILENFKAATWD